MEQPKYDGGAAFPHPEQQSVVGGGGTQIRIDSQPGMSLRDYFAGQALTGILADSGWADTEEKMAELSYRFADAMIAARDA